MSDGKIQLKHPNPDKQAPRIDRWKHDAVRRAILTVLDHTGEDGFRFSDLPDAVADQLSEDELARLGSVGWYTTTIKLHMEAVREIERIENVSPQRLRRIHT